MPDPHRRQSPLRPAKAFVHWLNVQTFGPIMLFVGVGLGLVVSAVWLHESVLCDPYGRHDLQVCLLIQNSPPWVPLAGLAATPTALLTWYWRTIHRKAEIENAKAQAETARSQELTSRFAAAVEMLANGALGGIYALERIARDSSADHWAVMEVLAAYVREYSPGMASKDRGQSREARIRVQAAITVLGRRTVVNDPQGRRLDLSNATLTELDFTGLDFTGAEFSGAIVYGATFDRADLRGATFHRVEGAAHWNDATKLDDYAEECLRRAGGVNGDGQFARAALAMRGADDPEGETSA